MLNHRALATCVTIAAASIAGGASAQYCDDRYPWTCGRYVPPGYVVPERYDPPEGYGPPVRYGAPPPQPLRPGSPFWQRERYQQPPIEPEAAPVRPRQVAPSV